MPVVIPQQITYVPFGQPILIIDAIGGNNILGDPSNFPIEQNENDCRDVNDPYVPFYAKGDFISLQFVARNEGFFDAEGDCNGNFTYGVKIISDSGGSDSTMFSPFIFKEIDAGNSLSQYAFWMEIPNTLTQGCHHLEIYITGGVPFCANNTITVPYLLATSQPMAIYDSPPDCSVNIVWGSKNDMFDFIYEVGTGGFNIQSTRISALQWKPTYNEDVSPFKDSKGSKFILSAISEPVYELIIGLVPEYIHNALRLAKLHDTFLINGVGYDVISKDYTPEWSINSKVAEARLELTRTSGNSIRSNC